MFSESKSDINVLANVIRTFANVNCVININFAVDIRSGMDFSDIHICLPK